MIELPRRETTRLMLRFGLVGVLNTGFSYLLFATLSYLGLPSALALVLATVGSIAFNFQTARRLVFRSPGRSIRFVIMYGVLLALNWLLLRLLATEGLSDIAAQGLLVVPIAVLSFVGQKIFVFSVAADNR